MHSTQVDGQLYVLLVFVCACFVVVCVWQREIIVNSMIAIQKCFIFIITTLLNRIFGNILRFIFFYKKTVLLGPARINY